MGKMTWYAGSGKSWDNRGGHYFARLEDGTEVEVTGEVYQQKRKEYLLSKGAEYTSYSGIEAKAQQERNTLSQFLDAFDEDVEQWLEEPQREGVFIKRPDQKNGC